MDVSRNAMLGELANDAAARADRLHRPGDGAAGEVPRPEPRARRGARRADADRRRSRLPLDRPRRDVPRPEPVRGPDDGRVGRPRPRSSRTPSRARGALQPGRDLRLVRRGRPRGRRAGRPADRGRRPARRRRRPARGDVRAGRPTRAVRGRGRRRGPPGQPAVRRRRRRGVGAALAMYNLALDFQERSQASEARLIDQFEEAVARLSGRLGDLIIVDDEDERLVLGGDRPVPGRGPARGLQRPVARAQRAPTTSSSSTTRPTCSATSPTRSPRPSRPSPPTSRPRTARAEDGEDAEASRSRGRGRSRTRTPSPTGRRQRARAPRRRPSPPGTERMRLAGAELVERREILPGTWLQAWHAPGSSPGVARRASTSTCGRSSPAGCPSDGRYPIATADPASGTLTIQAPGAPPSRGVGRRAPARATARTWRDRSGGRSRSTPRSRHLLLIAEGRRSPGCGCSSTRRSATAAPSCCCTGRRRRARSIRPACSPTRSSTSSRPPTGRWATAGSVLDLVPGTRRGRTRRSRRARPALLAALAALAAGRRERLGVATLGRKRGGGTAARRRARRRRGARRSSRSCVDQVDRLCRRDVPRLRGRGRRRGPAAGLPRGPGVRRRRARVGRGTVA